MRRPAKIDRATILIAAALVPVTIVAHEAGHLLAGLIVGVPGPRLGLAGFTHGPAPWLTRGQVAAIAAAGPAVTLVLASASLWRAGPRRAGVVAAMSVAACMRLLEVLPFALAALARWVRGAPARPTTFDEDRAFQMLGLPGAAALIGAAFVFAVLLSVTLRRQPGGSAAGLILGASAGWVAWRTALATGAIG